MASGPFIDRIPVGACPCFPKEIVEMMPLDFEGTIHDGRLHLLRKCWDCKKELENEFGSNVGQALLVRCNRKKIMHKLIVTCDDTECLERIRQKIPHVPRCELFYGSMYDDETIKLEITKSFTDNPLTTDACFFCLAHRLKKEPKFKCCGKCKLAYYCSVECQKEDWINHKGICKDAAQVENNATDIKVDYDGCCPHLDEWEKHMFSGMHQKHCARKPCTKPVRNNGFFEHHIVSCTSVKCDLHAFITGFCSGKCRKKFINKHSPNPSIYNSTNK